MFQPVPEGHYCDVGDGLRIHYQDAGPKDGPVVVFLHGSGPGASGWSNFRRNYPFFAERGFRTVVPDTLGFGYSSKPEDRDYALPYVVGLLRRFTEALGLDRIALVGNSHGGALAIQYTLNHPETVSHLVLMAPGGLETTETYLKMDGIRAMMRSLRDGITRDSLRAVFGLQLYDPSRITDEILDERLSIATTQPRRVMTTLGVPHLAPELSRITCPVFGLWGMQDKFCPPTGAVTIAELCPNARVLLLSRCGHWVMVEYPELFNQQCLEFLRGLPA